MSIAQFIDPLTEFGHELYSIQKPGRYVGGELKSREAVSPDDPRYRMALCFPDLYEIGMSNNAMRILYNDLGRFRDRIVCERVFAPAPDFEALLARRSIQLYTLESGIPLRDCDMLCFSVGYELLATNMLGVLKAGGIPIRSDERGEGDPIVIAGGPAITNPHPFGFFLDAVYIGEAEAGFYDLAVKAASMKAAGAGREAILELLRSCPSIWMPSSNRRARPGKVLRAIQADFGKVAQGTDFPIPAIPTIQGHGTVEIMRGCPNGCRFCHAGYFYRPQRVKPVTQIEAEVAALVEEGGYREITLSSLSSGDYPDIAGLFRRLNARWKDKSVSFQLPSLKVDSFTLPLLSELSEVRKSGLTFAVETPVERWQGSINKIVSFEKVASILKEAKQYGFKSAKFYFMIGLPLPGKGRGEAEAIIDFLVRIAQVERIALNVNIGTFIPKPHTPYERAGQLGEEEALNTVYFIKDSLKPYHRFISVSYHTPFTSVLEGILSRGDSRVGDLVLDAYEHGARLDAWDEYFKKDVWKECFARFKERHGFDPVERYLAERSLDESLPWNDINLFITNKYIENERKRSEGSELTGACTEDCDHPCGSCNDRAQLILSTESPEDPFDIPDTDIRATQAVERARARGFSIADSAPTTLEDIRFVASFRKEGNASLFPLHSISSIFARAFLIMGLPVRFTEGFNPMPRMELTQPLALGMESSEDLMAVWLSKELVILDLELFLKEFNRCLPRGIHVESVRIGNRRSLGKKSIGSLYWGSRYEVHFSNPQDFGLASQSNLAREALEEFTIDQNEMKVSVRLADARGGERNIQKILSGLLACEKPLERCSIRRMECFSLQDGALARLFEQL